MQFLRTANQIPRDAVCFLRLLQAPLPDKRPDILHTVENSWFERLWQDEAFRERVCERYVQLRKTTLSDEHIAEKIASYQEKLGEAVDRNFKVWGYSFKENLLAGTSKEGTSRNIRSYEEAMKQLTDTIRERLAYLDKELGGN